MKKGAFSLLAVFAAIGFLQSGAAVAQAPSTSGSPIHMTVTAESSHGYNVPTITPDDVMVYEGKTRDKVTEWVPAQGNNAALDFFVLVDDSANTTVGTQLDDIRQFINAQPASTRIGVAYMQNGTANILQNPTNDHAKAAKSLRLPLGEFGINASPYLSLQDLIKRWPADGARHGVLMISDGIDPLYGAGDMQDPYVQGAIDQAQRAGVVVFAIYTPGVGHFARSFYWTWWGQLYLSQVCDQSGGESYYLGFTGAPVSFVPYLDEVSHRLNHQYLLTFLAKPEEKAGFQRVRVTTELSNTELVSAPRVYVPGQP